MTEFGFAAAVWSLVTGVSVLAVLFVVVYAYDRKRERARYCVWEVVDRLIDEPAARVEGGRWARKTIRCSRCSAHRRVWVDLPLTHDMLNAVSCPSEDYEAMAEGPVDDVNA